MSIEDDKVYFQGIRNDKNKKHFLILVRESDGKSIEIPVTDTIANHIMVYILKLVNRSPELVERGNDEPSV